MKKLTSLLFISLLCLQMPARAEDPTPVEQSQEQPSKREIKEEQSETTHTITIGGEDIHYKATAGTMILKDSEGKSKASVFYIAYTKEGVENTAERPVTFCFNGGPGSSAIWLHLGVFGPKRVELSEEGYAVPPYRVIDNQYSILDRTDLVFIDPVSTGYSRAAPGEDPKQFHGVEEDIKSVAEFIRLYTTRNKRWGSPKYLAGESYGTTRAAGLAGHLHDHHRMYLDGVILLSSVLNFQTLYDGNRGNDIPYMLYLPSYTAAAWYHKKLPQELLQKPLQKVLAEVEQFVIDDYSQALLKGRRLSDDEKSKVTEKLAYYTGLSEKYITRTNLRINIHRFCRELLRDEERTIGRFDSRYKGIEADGVGEYSRHDASADAIFGGFAAAFNQYISKDLKWEKDEPYKVLSREVWPWDFGKTKNEYLNVSETLREVMTRNPRLKVFIASGYYDLATPYFATEYTVDHLGLDPSLDDHIKIHYYDGGHMMYTHRPSLIKLKQDLNHYLKNSSPKKEPAGS